MLTDASQLQMEHLYREYKPLLLSLAYRMLGSMSEAEDAVQDVFVAVSKLDLPGIEHPKAYIVKMLTHRVLNLMKAAPRNREHYPGLWLPEPIIDMDTQDGPQERVLRQERLGYAILVLLQNCTPHERAVFVLRKAASYDYTEIAAMLDKSEAACRKLYSRACAKIGQRAGKEREYRVEASLDRFVQAFGDAIDTGRFDAFVQLLTGDAVLLSDGGGVVRAALNPIHGRDRIAAFFTGIAGKGSLTGQLHRVWISEQPGLLLLRGESPPFAFALEPDEGLDSIRTVYLISNPHKLMRITTN